MTRIAKAIILTSDDWNEIDEALATKCHDLERGRYGKTDADCDVEKWRNHLRRIRLKINRAGVLNGK